MLLIICTENDVVNSYSRNCKRNTSSTLLYKAFLRTNYLVLTAREYIKFFNYTLPVQTLIFQLTCKTDTIQYSCIFLLI